MNDLRGSQARWAVLLVLLVIPVLARSQTSSTACSVGATAPVAVPDHVPWPGGPVTVDVLGNDYDRDGDVLVIQSFTTPQQGGTVTFSADAEALVYTPPAAGAGNDRFSYTISDGTRTATATVTLSADLPPPTPGPSDPEEPTEPPPPAEPRVWFDYSCTNITCHFYAQWENIPDAPRYFHWNFGTGTTPPYYNSRGAVADFPGPGQHVTSVTITFVSGVVHGSGPLPVTVPNPQIQCSFGAASPSPLSYQPGLPTVSNSNQGGFLNYRYTWHWGDGTTWVADPHTVLQNRPDHRYAEEGPRLVRFTIQTQDGTLAGECAQQVEIVNQPPVPNFTSAPGDGVNTPRKRFQFNGSATDEWYPQLGIFEWNFGDGTFATDERAPAHLYARPGNYTVVLKVTDIQGVSGTVEKTITVADEPPRAHLLFECAGRKCRFDSRESLDDSEVMTFHWNFGDGSPVVTTERKDVEHTFATDGPFDVILTVDDGTNETAKRVRVTPRAQALAPALVFYSVPPCRVIDTVRDGRPLSTNQPASFPVAGLCGIPADAKAVAVNLTVESTQAGHLFLHPAGSPAPVSSAIHFFANAPRSNFYIPLLGSGGALTAHGFSTSTGVEGTLRLAVDVTGYFSDQLSGSGTGPLRYDRFFKGRAFDTRTMPPTLASGVPRPFLVRKNVYSFPADAAAHIFHLRPGSFPGTYSLYPSNLPSAPNTPILTGRGGTYQETTFGIIGLGNRANDDVNVLWTSSSSATSNDPVVDTYGWFARNAPGRYYAIEPCRAADTRQPGHGERVPRNDSRFYQVKGNCGVPRDATGVVVVVRLINPDGDGRAFAGGFDAADTPDWWTMSYRATDLVASTHIIAPTPGAAWNGVCCVPDLAITAFGGGMDVVFDVLGYFVAEENQPPKAATDVVNAVVNVPVRIQVLANDVDPNADALALSETLAVFSPPVAGTAVRADATTISYMAAEGPGSDSFQYQVVDARGATAVGNVKITIHETAQAPVAADDSAAVTGGSLVRVDVVANDSDPNNEPLRLSTVAIVDPPLLGTATRESDRTITYRPRDGVGGTDALTYEVRNERGITSYARLTIRIQRKPTATTDTAVLQAGQSSVTVDVLANDADPDGQTLTLANPAIVAGPVRGTVTVHADGRRLVYAGTTGLSDQFTYAIADSDGERATGTVNVVINRPPVAVTDSAAVTGTSGEITVTANDSDPDGDVVRLAGNPIRTFPTKGSVLRLSDSTVRYYPATGASGTDSFTLEVVDHRGGSAIGTVQITICSSGPVITAHPATTAVLRGQPATLTVTATGPSLSYQWYQGPAPSVATPVGGNSATLTVTPAATTQYWVRVSSPCGTVNSATATVTVNNNPPRPFLTFGCLGATCEFSGLRSTDDVSIASWAWTFSDNPSAIAGTNPTITKTLPAGCYTATLSVADNQGATATTRQTLAAGNRRPQWPSRAGGVNVDTHASSYQPPGPPGLVNTTGNLNGILEPGERVVVEPTWQVTGGGTFASTATVTSSSAAISATMLDAAASYATAEGYSNCWATGNCFVVEAKTIGTRDEAHVDLRLTESTSMPGVSGPSLIHVGGSFSDVPVSSSSYAAVEAALHYGLTTGCAAGQFCPSTGLTRGMIAIWLLRAKYGATYTPPACDPANPPFPDVDCSYWAAPWIGKLKADGITTGTGGGNYQPETVLSRAELAVFLLRTVSPGLELPACPANGPYGDVACSHWGARWITALKERNFAIECEPGKFCPDRAVGRGEAAELFYRAFALALDRRICTTTTIYTSTSTESTGGVQ